jgi:Cu-processing system ATP-binding protein
VIAFHGFSKSFGSLCAVNALDLEVARGEIVALLGPNGSGKTTTLKAAAGLVRPTAGTVTIGDPPRRALEPAARKRLSYLPQRVSFPEALTGREVVEFYRALRGAPAARTAEVLHFAALNGSSDRPVGTYSGGMTQRLGLAVAMVPDADVLLLDEPTAALDAAGLAAFYGLMETRRSAGRTVLFTSHYIGDAERLADRCVVLVQGRMAASLTQAELRTRLSARDVREGRLDLLYRELIGGEA